MWNFVLNAAIFARENTAEHQKSICESLRLFQLDKLCPFHVEKRCFIFTLHLVVKRDLQYGCHPTHA
jgi:hypothetical protein